MSKKSNELLFKQTEIKLIKSIDPVNRRCYAEVIFADGYQTSVNLFENKSNGCIKDSYLGMVIPEGSDYISFTVSRRGFGKYHLSKLSLTMLGGKL